MVFVLASNHGFLSGSVILIRAWVVRSQLEMPNENDMKSTKSNMVRARESHYFLVVCSTIILISST